MNQEHIFTHDYITFDLYLIKLNIYTSSVIYILYEPNLAIDFLYMDGITECL